MHCYELIIRERHLDVFGHVNNATYLEILEEARWEMVTQRGFSLETVQRTRTGPVILEIHIKFMKEITLRQKLRVESEIIEHKHKIGKLRQVVHNQQHACCEAIVTFGFFDLDRRRLIAPTPAWEKAVGLSESPA